MDTIDVIMYGFVNPIVGIAMAFLLVVVMLAVWEKIFEVMDDKGEGQSDLSSDEIFDMMAESLLGLGLEGARKRIAFFRKEGALTDFQMVKLLHLVNEKGGASGMVERSERTVGDLINTVTVDFTDDEAKQRG